MIAVAEQSAPRAAMSLPLNAAMPAWIESTRVIDTERPEGSDPSSRSHCCAHAGYRCFRRRQVGPGLVDIGLQRLDLFALAEEGYYLRVGFGVSRGRSS